MISSVSTVLVTICTIRQLPQAVALGASFIKYASEGGSTTERVVIGLADDPAHLPADFQSPYPLLPVRELFKAEQLVKLSAQYTPTEFAAACKPVLIREIFRRFPDTQAVVYADPNIQFFSSLSPIWEKLVSANVLLTPHITHAPAETNRPNQAWPDEKFFQNVGLFCADFLAFRRSNETDRLLAWWQDRVEERAFIDFCIGLCTDQLWLMHVPVFFNDVVVIKDPAWHVALWNLPQRTLQEASGIWRVNEGDTPLLFVNFKGLYNTKEGFFVNQNRLKLAARPDLARLVSDYKKALAPTIRLPLLTIQPAYGQQPEPVVLLGWRWTTVKAIRSLIRFIDKVPLPVLR